MVILNYFTKVSQNTQACMRVCIYPRWLEEDSTGTTKKWKNHFIVDGYERNDENLEIIAHEDVKHVKVKIIVDNKCQGS